MTRIEIDQRREVRSENFKKNEHLVKDLKVITSLMYIKDRKRPIWLK